MKTDLRSGRPRKVNVSVRGESMLLLLVENDRGNLILGMVNVA